MPQKAKASLRKRNSVHFEFANPPIAEVALSVLFEALTELRAVHVGQWWRDKLQADFPTVQEQPPLPPVIETFAGNPPQQNVQLVLTATGTQAANASQMQSWPMNRCWLLSERGDRLIQVQADRLLFNWRRLGESEVYPRYEWIREIFAKTLSSWREFIQAQGFGILKAKQCELTYVNQITSGDGWSTFSEIGDVFSLSPPAISAQLPKPEDGLFQFRYPITDTSGEKIGRLHINVQPALRAHDRKPMFVLQIAARGKPDNEGLNGIMAFLDEGHQLALQAFLSVTSSRMQRIWKATK